MSASNKSSPFYTALERALDQRGTKIEDICPPDDQIARRVLQDYGAMFVAHEAVVPPPACVFADEDAVADFQKAAGRATTTIVDALIELQPSAMTALLLVCANVALNKSRTSSGTLKFTVAIV